MTPLNDIRCDLGEGAFWHPARAEFFWFDITGQRLHSLARSWDFDEMVSAMGWVDKTRVVIAAQTRMLVFDLHSGTSRTLCALEAENAATRSNDGRIDPQGGFWIGTMGKRAEAGAGAIWRWHKGELRRLFAGLTIPNAICFAPDRQSACFTDTMTRRIMRVALDAEGWPKGAPECWLDLSAERLNPDGAVFDAAGNFWVAQWGAGRVAAYAPSGQFLQAVDFPAPHTSCPAFGGDDLRQLYCTTARQGRQNPNNLDGATFVTPVPVQGLREYQFHLDDA
ncbi:SMP-30/gluconolactonase/LRE family protein [Roseinatronobacter monicus]|uniref:Sugar lactone lactonase YvrE n=1 Tax=Roseinatronobacter monicus TaxID=393481 RepID=A0A543KCB5_9RHOB|nr:SMP-30/gluconolactonase/LRE family protein [Roseinatronobacter monicus]TQM92730.1 sugar lactone lactonase YvrE [Roseinatronobacter monicus]